MNALFPILLTAFLFFVLVWLISVFKKDMSIVDIAWGPGFMLVGWVGIFYYNHWDLRSFIVVYLLSLWGIRLAAYIAVRNKGKGEDPRYAAWRADWGKNTWWISFFKVYVLQAVLMILIASPVHVILFANQPIPAWTDTLGICVWLIGFLFESIADGQLYRFKKNPANQGKVLETGLWRYSRHPNYFGEALIWWGIFILSLGSGYWYLSLIGPVLITFLLLKVSGVTLLEQRYEGNSQYAAYKRRTSPFLPLPPKK